MGPDPIKQTDALGESSWKQELPKSQLQIQAFIQTRLRQVPSGLTPELTLCGIL